MRYEILLLAIPEITGDEASRLESQLREIISEKKGSCISFERWGKFKLLYPVKKNDYGVYFLTRLEAGTTQVRELLTKIEALIQLKYNEIVMRYLINKLDERRPLTYQRPESLEEAPGKVTDSLLREHKVDFGSEGRGSRHGHHEKHERHAKHAQHETHENHEKHEQHETHENHEKFEGSSSEESAWQRK